MRVMLKCGFSKQMYDIKRKRELACERQIAREIAQESVNHKFSNKMVFFCFDQKLTGE